MLDLTPLPSAWMGYAPAEPGADRACVRICAYCSDKRQAEVIAEKADHDVTHGICPRCYNEQLARYLGEHAA